MWMKHHQAVGDALLARAGQDSFGACLIHSPLLYRAVIGLLMMGITNRWLL